MDGEGFDFDACLAQVREGDPEAARALVDALYPLVIRIARTHPATRQTENDLAQEIFLKMFAKLDQYQPRPGIPLTHWVSRLSIRTCLDIQRAERRRPELRWSDLSADQCQWLEYLVTDETQAPPDNDLGTRDLVDKLLSGLHPKDRLVLTLADLEQKSIAEISSLTGWTRATVKVRIFRARQRLRRLAGRLTGGSLP